MRAQSFCPWTLEHRLNSCGAQAELLQGMWDLLRSGTSRILCHWATGEALLLFSNPGPIKDVAVRDPEGDPEWSSNCPFSGCVCMWSPCDWWASQATSGPGTHGYSALSSDCSSTCEKAVYKFYHSCYNLLHVTVLWRKFPSPTFVCFFPLSRTYRFFFLNPKHHNAMTFVLF